MNDRGSKLAAGLMAFVVFVCSCLILQGYFETTVGRVILKGKFPPNAQVDVSLSNRFGSVTKHTVVFDGEHQSSVIRVGTPIINAPLNKLVFEFSAPVKTTAGLFNIYAITLTQPFGRDTKIVQSEIRGYFSSTDFFSPSSNVLQANATTGKAKLTLEKPVSSINRLWLISMSLFLALLAWLFVRHTRFSEVAAFADMRLGNNISSKPEFDMVNGLRGIAALLVLLSHAAPGFLAINMGIAILFVISGFLLSRPFVENPHRIYSWSKVETYLAKRVKRILPMYYFFIAVTYLATSQFDIALRNFLFLEASGHLWPMTQIFTFYICLPIVLLITSKLVRTHLMLPILLLFLMAIIWEVLMTDWKPFYNGRYATQFHLFAFLIGVAGSYINYGLLNSLTAWRAFISRWQSPLSIALLVVVVFTIAWSAPLRPPSLVQPFISQFYIKCLLALTIIILSLQLSSAYIKHLLANGLFRSVGVIGFSFYLLHGLGIELALNIQSAVFGITEPADRSWALTFIAFGFTYVMAVFTYTYIERPFFGYQPTKSVKD